MVGEFDSHPNWNLFFFACQGILLYTLFYMLCILGPVDIGKVEMLRSNTKVVGMLYCVICGF